jgi:hypothetical protein
VLCLLTDDNNDKFNLNKTTYYAYWMMTTTTNPNIRQPHIVFTDGWQPQIQPYYDHMLCLVTGDNDKPNHNTITCCVYWLTTATTNPTIIPPHIVFTDGWQRQIQPYYNHMCLLTGDNDKPNHNTTTCCVYWLTTTTTNPTIILPHIVFIDERQQQ